MPDVVLNKARNAPTRQDTWTIRVFLEGNDTGVWDKKTGGELDSEETKYSPGGMQPPISLGGRTTPGNLTLQRLYDGVADHSQIDQWFNAVGHGSVQVYLRPMSIGGGFYVEDIHYSGILKRVSLPDIDSESSSAALMEIEVSVGPDPDRVANPG